MWAFCSPGDIFAHIKEVVERLYLPEGGLMVQASIWDSNTTLENIEAICGALEKHVVSFGSAD